MQPSILYHRRDFARRHDQVALHEHPCWQLEWVERGKFAMTFHADAPPLILPCGNALLIPPHQSHRIRYLARTDYLSIKFIADLPESFIVAGQRLHNRFTSILMKALHDYLPPGEWMDDTTRRRSEQLLGAWLQAQQDQEQTESLQPYPEQTAGRAQATLEDPARLVTNVKQLAELLQFTPNHLAAAYRHQFGESLKAVIDRERARRATALLAYSDKNISEISESLAFPDVYSFSRFYKRVTGKPPSAFKKELARGRLESAVTNTDNGTPLPHSAGGNTPSSSPLARVNKWSRR